MTDLKQAAEFYVDFMTKMQSARTPEDVDRCAKVLDSAEFDRLPFHPGAREDMAALYAKQLFLVTGALAG